MNNHQGFTLITRNAINWLPLEKSLIINGLDVYYLEPSPQLLLIEGQHTRADILRLLERSCDFTAENFKSLKDFNRGLKYKLQLTWQQMENNTIRPISR